MIKSCNSCLTDQQLLQQTQNISLKKRQHVKPEEKARQKIDQLLVDAGWVIQDHKDLNLGASLGVAVREFPISPSFWESLVQGLAGNRKRNL
jgi:hypothetical protein